MLLSVELCSLTLQRDDVSVANLIASRALRRRRGGGGAGRRRAPAARGPRVVGHPVGLLPRHRAGDGLGRRRQRASRWCSRPRCPRSSGARRRRRRRLPRRPRPHARATSRHWIAHTGGPKVLEAFEDALELPDGALARTWKSLRGGGQPLVGLGALRARRPPRRGRGRARRLGLLMAMGPGLLRRAGAAPVVRIRA